MIQNKPKILVIGSINFDIIYHDVITEGMNYNGMVYRSYRTANGGKGSNQAAALALLGADVTLIGCVGSDINGSNQLKALEDMGVHTDYISVCQGFQTGQSVMLIRKDGTYIGANVMGANERLLPEIVLPLFEKQAFDMIVMQLEMPLETVYQTYIAAAQHNIPVILDLGPAKQVDMSQLQRIYMLTPNEDETQELTGIRVIDGESALQAAHALYKASQAQHIVLKLGKMGAFYYNGSESRLFPSFPVNAVDSTAAGDSFTAELAIRLCAGDDMENAIKASNAAGAICVSRYGGQPSVPTVEEVAAYLAGFGITQ